MILGKGDFFFWGGADSFMKPDLASSASHTHTHISTWDPHATRLSHHFGTALIQCKTNSFESNVAFFFAISSSQVRQIPSVFSFEMHGFYGEIRRESCVFFLEDLSPGRFPPKISRSQKAGWHFVQCWQWRRMKQHMYMYLRGFTYIV